MTTTVNLSEKKITFPFTFICDCCRNPHVALQFSEDMLSYLDYLLDYNKDFLEKTIKDEENETPEYREQCTEELEMLERLIKPIKPLEDNKEV